MMEHPSPPAHSQDLAPRTAETTEEGAASAPALPDVLRRDCARHTQNLLETISQERIDPPSITRSTTIEDIMEKAFLSYNAGRLREASRVFVEKMLADDGVVGVSLAGALTPAGLGKSSLVPLIEAGFIDWMVSTGANLYHDTHFALDMALHQSRPNVDDRQLREHGVIRIYDIVFDAQHLFNTDRFYRQLCWSDEFQRTMGTAAFHSLIGKSLAELEDRTGRQGSSILAAAYRAGVPIFTSSPGDSSIGMNLAAMQLEGSKLCIDPLCDVNASAAIVWGAKQRGKKSGVLLLGGGSPKNFMLQTEPQIQEVLGLEESGHDYFLQITDARPDTGGLSGATPQEAVTWGKVDPDKLPDTVTCYIDTTVALPLLTAYALKKRPPRPHRRFMDQLPLLTSALTEQYRARQRMRL